MFYHYGKKKLNETLQMFHKISIKRDIDSKDDILFNFSNCYWISGIVFLIVGTLFCSFRIITNQTPTIDLLIKIIEKYQVTTVLVVPYMIAELLQSKNLKKFPSVVNFITGGTLIGKSFMEKLLTFLPNGKIIHGYGSTEITGTVSISINSSEDVGQLVHNVEVKV